MTPALLAAIKARLAAADDLLDDLVCIVADQDDADTLDDIRADLPALVAEVERLRGEAVAAITRAERAGQALALAEQSIASATGGVYCTQCGDQLVTDGDDNLCWVCVGTLKSRVEAAEREVASEAKRADAMSRSALANYDQVVALNVALATAERERDEARARANESLARESARLGRLQAAVAQLFVNGFGDVADRLVMLSPTGRDLGGWSMRAAVARLTAALEGK